MRDDVIRCLDCGSSRFASYRGGAFAQATKFQQRPPPFYGNSPSKSAKKKSEKVDYKTDYDLMKANEQFRKLMEGGEVAKKDKDEEKTEKKEPLDASVEKPDEIAEKPKVHDPSTEEIVEMLHKTSVHVPPEAPVYDKTTSFFDDISCESKEKNEGTSNAPWNQDRNRTQETFGGPGGYFSRPYYQAQMPRGYTHQSPYKWNARNQQTFGVGSAYDSFGGPPGGYFPQKRSNYSNWYPKF